MKLVERISRKEIIVGWVYYTFRGEPATVTAIHLPKHAGSTGRVSLQIDGDYEQQFYPGVIDAEWDERPDA